MNVISMLYSSVQGVQLYIEIEDSDGSFSDNEVVDILLLNLNLTVAESLQQNHTGIYNLVTMNLTITMFCEGNFGGSDCSQCVSGFTGTNCEINIDDCSSNPCSERGQCVDEVNNFQCICDPGFTGELCQDIDDCVGVSCSGNGQCVDGVNSFQCTCDPGFTGDTCQTNIDDCVGVNCSGNGQCMDGVNNFTCECTPGFSGPLCSESGT